jgi:hypothetical protein
MDRVRLLTKKQLKQGSVAPRLKSSLQTSTVVPMEWLTVIKYQFLKTYELCNVESIFWCCWNIATDEREVDNKKCEVIICWGFFSSKLKQ